MKLCPTLNQSDARLMSSLAKMHDGEENQSCITPQQASKLSNLSANFMLIESPSWGYFEPHQGLITWESEPYAHVLLIKLKTSIKILLSSLSARQDHEHIEGHHSQ